MPKLSAAEQAKRDEKIYREYWEWENCSRDFLLEEAARYGKVTDYRKHSKEMLLALILERQFGHKWKEAFDRAEGLHRTEERQES